MSVDAAKPVVGGGDGAGDGGVAKPGSTRPTPAILAIAALALGWGIGPALPAMSRGELLGHGLTDLYPSVWGLWWFSSLPSGWPSSLDLLGFPNGMGFYYSSPIKGLLAVPLVPLIGLTATWNLLLVIARVATVWMSWAAARSWGLSGAGALAAAAVFGCSPFFHGYAVEGLAEGSDGWTLALLAWALGRQRRGVAAFSLWLTILSSWYLGMVGCVCCVLAAIFRDWRDGWSLIGVVAALPAVWVFLGAFDGAEPLPDAVRVAMGARLGVPSPGIGPGLSPFAINTYLGWSVGVLALVSRSRWVLLALLPAVLSLGRGPIYDLPIFELIRFPYRWHAATLLLLAPAVGLACQRYRLWWAAPLIVLEGLLLAPVEPVIPGADPSIPALYEKVDGPVLEIPGPLARPPGTHNPSRPRNRYLLYFQTGHGQPSPWTFDFNGLAPGNPPQFLDLIESWDRHSGRSPLPIGAQDLAAIRAAGVVYVMVQRREAGRLAASLREALVSAGARNCAEDEDRWLLCVSDPAVGEQPLGAVGSEVD